jgi:hypothetical protein
VAIEEAADSPSPAGDPSFLRARRLLYACLLVFTAGLLAGTSWDVYWHSRNTFDSFWTPPHLVLYFGVISTGIFALGCARSPALRTWFGEAFRFPFVGTPLPGPIVLVASGVVVTLFGGLLDDLWHSTYGLDETRWSLPHAMIAWGAYLVVLGLFSCRLAMRRQRAISHLGWLLWGVVLFGFSLAVVLGPLFLSTTAESMNIISHLPGFQSPATQHYFRLVAHLGLYRTHVLFPALVGLWAGLNLGMLDRLKVKERTVFEVTVAVTAVAMLLGLLTALYVGTLGSVATWLPPPIFVAAGFSILLQRRSPNVWPAYAVAGAALGVATRVIYGTEAGALLLSLSAAVTLPLGAAAGRRLAAVLEQPRPAALAKTVPLVGLLLPVALGVFDIVLRSATP